MNTIEISKICILPSRHRRDFRPESHQELLESIQDHGLFNAIVLRPPSADEPQELPYVLSSGERRLRAVSDIAALGGSFNHDGQVVPQDSIPYTLLGDLEPLERELCELDENIRRDDLTMQERAGAVSRIVELRRQMAVQSNGVAPSYTELALDLFEPARDGFKGSSGAAKETLRKQLIVARNLSDPEVAKAKTLDEAYKALRRKDSASRNIALAEKIGPTFTAQSHSAVQGDSIELLSTLPSEAFDVILTDPPYGMGANEFGDAGGRTAGEHAYEDSIDNFVTLLKACSEHLIRVAKPLAHLYWFCDIDNFHLAKDTFTAAGWWVHRTPLIWHKPGNVRMPWPEHGPQRKYELILYAVKGKRPILRIAPDVITINSDANLGHMAQKPVALFRDLLTRSCRPGDTVLDPFCGTGTVFSAAHLLKIKATGIEKDSASYGIALKRLEGLK